MIVSGLIFLYSVNSRICGQFEPLNHAQARLSSQLINSSEFLFYIFSCYLQQCKQCGIVLNYVLIDWVGGPDGKIFGWSWPKVKCFPVRLDLNQSISLFYHMTVVLFSVRAKTFKAAFASFRARFSSRALRVFPALSLDAYGPRNSFFIWFSNEIAREVVRIIW